MKVKIEQNVEQNWRYNSSRFLSYHKVFNSQNKNKKILLINSSN